MMIIACGLRFSGCAGYFRNPNALRYLPNAEYMELTFSLIHYDFDSELAQPVYQYSWNRQVVGTVVSSKELKVDFCFRAVGCKIELLALVISLDMMVKVASLVVGLFHQL